MEDPELKEDPVQKEEEEEARKREEEELVKRFRSDAFRQKMKLFAIALLSNVVFVSCMWMLPNTVIHAVFLAYIVIGALPKFIFGSLLRKRRPHVNGAKPREKGGDPGSRSTSTSAGGIGRTASEDQEAGFAWHISTPTYRCPRCQWELMGWPHCRGCGLAIEAEHPILVTACCTVHHESREGIESGVRSFELSVLPFERRFMHVVYVVDGRFTRTGKLDLQQRGTVVFLLSRLFGVQESAVSCTGGPDECPWLVDPRSGARQPVKVGDDGTAVYWGAIAGAMPFTVLVKRQNRGKRDSHRLFFDSMHNGILARTAAGVLFVDSDTMVAWDGKTDSLQKLFDGLLKRENVGGVCGEIEVARWTTNPLTMMQYFEYKSNQFLAKTGESWFGMVTCLPGAFSMIRPQALEMILNGYLANSHNIWQTNQLDLGEDRTLTTLLLKKGWDTVYVPKAVARTEVPSTLLGIIKQRRRWINSTIVNMAILVKSVRRAAAVPLLISLALELGSSFTLPTAILMLFVETFAGMHLSRPFVVGLVVLWVIALILFSMTATAESAEPVFTASTSVGAFMIAMMVIQIVQNIGSLWNRAWLEMVVMLGWMAIVIAAAAVHGQWRAVVNLVAPLSWLFLSPMMWVISLSCFEISHANPLNRYVIIPIYAISNFDDASWGTRGV